MGNHPGKTPVTPSPSHPNYELPWRNRIVSEFKSQELKPIPFEGTLRFFTPTLFFKDAVSRCVLEEVELARLICPRVVVYAENRIGEMSGAARSWTEFSQDVDQEKDILIYHYSIGTESLKQALKHPVRKHAIYHGITPPALVRVFSPETAELCEKGITEFPLLNEFQSWMTNSEFLMGELQAFESTPHKKWILPPFLTLDKWDDIGSEAILPETDSASGLLLYVGRRNPSKNLEGLIEVLFEIRKLGNYRLVIAGTGATPSYHTELQNLIDAKGLQDHVRFIDEPSDQGLKFLYEASDALITTSLHEGFCVPLAEAMKLGLPAFAFPNSALQQTLGSTSPALVPGKPAESAERIHRVLENASTRDQLIAEQGRQYRSRFSDRAVLNGYYNYFKHIMTHE